MKSRARHRLSHAELLTDVSEGFAGPVRPTRYFDAIVVPATRPAALQRIIALSADISVPLVLLCSRQAQVDSVAQRVEDTFGARALVVDTPAGYRIGGVRQATEHPRFRDVSAGRSSDLSLKRNLGLLIARLRGWRKVLFVDDDISDLRPQDIANLAGQLDRYPVAAMRSFMYPDNSVVCHAGRLAGLAQDVFVSGAVLAVDTQRAELPFFPNVYNEDWFFFARQAAGRALPKVGEVRQDSYDPFADPGRAATEEFGDLIGEGLYSLFDDTRGWTFREQLRVATHRRYWRSFIADRQVLIADIVRQLDRGLEAARGLHGLTYAATDSLRYAEKQLAAITPDLCVEFIRCWRDDTEWWQSALPPRGLRLGERDALEALGLDSWVSCGYGSPVREPAGLRMSLSS